jgi:hypothetical protein
VPPARTKFTDANDDLVVPCSLALLDVDVASERCGDRGREVVAGELLRALVELEVSIGDVDGLVRHVCIVSPGCVVGHA